MIELIKMNKSLFAATLFCGFLAACGGGTTGTPGGETRTGPLSGISASDGAAMAFGSVMISSLVDSTIATGTLDIDGNFNIPSSGVTYPAIVKAQSLSGEKVNYGYIADVSQTNAPVNPISTLVLSIAFKGNPAAITTSGQLPASSLSQANTAVNSIFAEVFKAFSVSVGSDLLKTNFAVNHTGLDFVLDALRIKFDAMGNPTVCTKLLHTCRTFDLANLDTSALPITQAEVSLLNAAPISTCSNSIKSITGESITSNPLRYAPDFLNSGLDGAAYRQALAAKLGGLSAAFNNPIFVGTDANDNYVFQFDYLNASNNQYAGSFSMPFKLNSARECVMAGDQLPFQIQAASQITAQIRVDGTNEAAVTTATPIRGLVFRAGGDGFGGTSVQNTVTVDGSPVQIWTLQFFLCDANNDCSKLLMEMVKGSNNNGFYYTPNGVNTIPAISYRTAGLASAEAFYNGNPRPILVKMLDQNSMVRKQARINVRGAFISEREMTALSLPSVTNAQALLGASGSTVNPQLDLNIPNGVLVQGVSVSSGLVSGQVTSTPKFVLRGASGSFTVSRTITSDSTYRSIQLGASTTGGAIIAIKYVWSPTCSGCS